jgi:hypothetical protein
MVAGPRKRDEKKLHSKVARGKRAEALINDPLFQEALDAISKEIEMGWKNSSAGESGREIRDNAYLMHRLLLRLKGQFKSIMVDGGNAQKLLSVAEEERGGRDKPNPKSG